MGKNTARNTRRHAHGSLQVESSVGITTLRSLSSPQAAAAQHAQLLASRPTALMKWSFDDFIVEEVLPPGLTMTQEEAATSATQSRAILVPITSEGVPDGRVEQMMRHLCRPLATRIDIRFCSPMDFVSCTTRHAWVAAPHASSSAQLFATFQHPQHLRSPDGDIFLGPCSWCSDALGSEVLNTSLLPDLRYTVVLRNIRGALADVLPRLRGLKEDGCLNYTHIARHGSSTRQCFERAHMLMQRNFPGFLQDYVASLVEGSQPLQQELPLLMEVLASKRSTRREWEGIQRGVEAAISMEREKMRRPCTGLYAPHHAMLLDFVQRAADLAPRRHDAAQLIRECISPLVVRESMRSISDVYFNTLTSIRWESMGAKVCAGDLIARTQQGPHTHEVPSLDHVECHADHMEGGLTRSTHDWLRMALTPGATHGGAHALHLEQVGACTSGYALEDVVLPFYGNGVEELPLLPANVGGTSFHALANELNVEAVGLMRTASPASYRRLVVRPRNCSFFIKDDERGWEWEEDAASTALKERLYRDQEGITRFASPVMDLRKKNVVARYGIRGKEARHHLLKPAMKNGMLCVVQLTLPRGTSITSALREVVQLTTLSPSVIRRLLV